MVSAGLAGFMPIVGSREIWAHPVVHGEDRAGVETIQAALEQIRLDAGLPSLIAGYVDVAGDCQVQCCGLRNAQNESKLLVDDSIHLGSCTKSMTATLVAMFIEEGKLQWNSTLGDLCQGVRANDAQKPESLALDKTGWGQVTVEQIMEHSAALPANAPWAFWLGRKDLIQAREEIAGWLTSQSFDPEGLGKYVYSNVGYMLLGHFLERITKQPWEEIIEERLFQPLGMTSAGFGSPAELKEGQGVWGHYPTNERKAMLQETTDKASLELSKLWHPTDIDNPPVLGPAGTVHASMQDWAKYLRTHLLSPGDPDFPFSIGKENWDRLHTPKQSTNYAGGWLVENRTWADGTVYFHNGSNAVWYCMTFLAPKKGIGVFAASNCGLEATSAVDKALQLVINSWLPLRG